MRSKVGWIDPAEQLEKDLGIIRTDRVEAKRLTGPLRHRSQDIEGALSRERAERVPRRRGAVASGRRALAFLPALRFHRLTVVPWFLPGLILAIGVGYLGRKRAARWLGISPLLGWWLIVAVGAILAATLTPLSQAAASASGPAGCDLSRLGLAPLEELTSINDTSLNVLMFIPLGIVIALCPASRARRLVLVGAIALPFVIESTQLVVTALARGCQSADVIDNLTGLVLGLAIGAVAARLWRSASPSDRGTR